MKRKVVSVLCVIVVLFSLVALTGCKKENSNVNLEQVEIQEKLKSIQANAIISQNLLGGDCNEYFEYYICYESAKLYVYKIFTYYPMTDGTEKNNNSNSGKHTLNEYNISKEQLENLKKIIESERKIGNTKRNSQSDYVLKNGEENYYMVDNKAISEILEGIKNNPKTVTIGKEIENTVRIHIVDVLDNMWSENLDVELTKEETEQLVKYLKSMNGEYKKIGWAPAYKIQCIDQNGNIIKELGMALYSYTDYNGVTYKESDDMKKFIETIEKKYKLTEVNGRITKPGKEYFYFLDKCNIGELEKNFGLHNGNAYYDYERGYNLTNEDIQELIKLKNEIELNSSKSSNIPDNRHNIILKDNNTYETHMTYNFRICENGDVYCNGYKATGKGIEQWMKYLNEKYK